MEQRLDQRASDQPARELAAPRGITLFRVAGIQIRLDYSWFLIFLLVTAGLAIGYFPTVEEGADPTSYWIAGLVSSLLFFASILVHELSHAFMAVRAGIRVPDITLFLFGGMSRMEEEPRDPPTELRIAIVGPGTSLLLALGFWLAHYPLLDGHWMPPAILKSLAGINLALGIFNMLPGFPLDGGRVLRAIVWWRTGSLERGTRTASDAGKALAVGLMILGGLQILAGALMGGLWLILIGAFLRSLAQQGYETLVLRRALEDARVEQVMAKELITVGPETTLRELVDDFLLAYGYHAFPVVENGLPLGLVSAQDVRKVAKEKWESTRVDEVMNSISAELSIEPDAGLLDALRRLEKVSRGRLLVLHGDRLVGMVSSGSLSRFVEIRRLLEGARAPMRPR